MNLVSSLFFLLAAPALASATDDRDLQAIADWHVTIDSVNTQGFTFNTGPGGGLTPNVKISVTDKCRMEAAAVGRTSAGDFYPTPSVTGINVDNTLLVANPGAGTPSENAVSFSFGEGISDNAVIYTPNPDTNVNDATVDMCVRIGLYDDTVLVDFAEVKLTYMINLETSFAELTGYTVSQAEAFTDAADTDITFDGTLEAFFCDENNDIILAGAPNTHQGSIMNVCVKAADGQFEVADIMDMTIQNVAVGNDPSQVIIASSAVAEGPYATKTCTDTGVADTNLCVVSFLLKADFYDFEALTLTGTGTVLLEFGDSAGTRHQLRRKLNVKATEEEFSIKAQEFQVDRVEGSSAVTVFNSLMTVGGALAGAALALWAE